MVRIWRTTTVMANHPSDDAGVGTKTAAPAPKPRAPGALGALTKTFRPIPRGWTIAILAILAWIVLVLIVLGVTGIFTR